MKLAHMELTMIIDWPENNVPILVIESPRRFRQLVWELANQCDGASGGFVLSKDWEPLSISKACDLIREPLFTQINDRQTAAALSKWLKSQMVCERMFMQTQDIRQRLSSWLCDLADQSEEPLCFAAEPDLSQILKVCGMEFEGDDCDLPERILRRIRVGQTFLSKDCYIFVNLKHYLEGEELRELYQSAFYRKARLLLIENICPQIDREYETAWIIDKDDCEIFPEEI